MSRCTRSLAAAAAVLLVTGCSATATGAPEGSRAPDDPADSGVDQEREWEVAEDPSATTAEMIEVGGPADVAVSADGERRVVTWRVEPEDDEGSTWGAWRLYDAAGARVADGFLLLDYATGRWQHLSPDGTLAQVSVERGARRVQADDVLLDPYAGDVYRSADRTIHPLPDLPTRDPQGVAVEPSGVVDVVLPQRPRGDVVVSSSPGGAGPWRRTTLDVAPDAFPSTLTTAADGTVLLPTLLPDQDFGSVDAVLRRDDDRWRRVVVPARLGLSEPTADVVDGRLLLSDGTRTFLQADDAATFAELEPPGDDTRVVVAGDRLWAWGLRGTTLWSSDDLGAEWAEVDR